MFAIFANILVAVGFAYALEFRTKDLTNYRIVLLCLITLTFIMSVVLYAYSVCSNPGFIESKYNFIDLIDRAIRERIDLNNFCPYCEIVKTETYFHCQICRRCVENFDHHCPFIDNCLGYQNHFPFLMFLTFYTFYLLFIMMELIRRFAYFTEKNGLDFDMNDVVSILILILITLHVPVLLYQLQGQCKGLCKI